MAKRYKVSTDALYRHSRAHLPPQLRASLIAGPDCDLDLDRLRETEKDALEEKMLSWMAEHERLTLELS